MQLAIFILVFIGIAGAWLGFWVVRKLVLTEEGSIDLGVAHFVTWAIRVLVSVMILQSSTEPLLAIEALVDGIIVFSILKRSFYPKVVRRAYEKSPSPYESPVNNSRFFNKPSTPATGSTSKSPSRVSESVTFYSTFHDTPDRKKLSKDDWDIFTRKSTRKALEDLVSSPDFSKWAVAHADRITLCHVPDIFDTFESSPDVILRFQCEISRLGG